jgi:hypothetical protein
LDLHFPGFDVRHERAGCMTVVSTGESRAWFHAHATLTKKGCSFLICGPEVAQSRKSHQMGSFIGV